MAATETKPEQDDEALHEAAELLERIEAAEERCRTAHSAWSTARERAKQAKASYDAAVGELQRLCRARKEPMPLFAQPSASDAWRELDIEELGLPDRIDTALRDADLETLGELSDLMAAGVWWHHELKGIGEKAAEQIADGFTEFWSRHPEYAQPEDGELEA